MSAPPRVSFIVYLSSNTLNSAQSASEFTTTFSKNIDLDSGKWSVALINLAVWNTNANVLASLGNNFVTYTDPGGNVKTITFPDGIWTTSDMIAYISAEVQRNNEKKKNPKEYLFLFPGRCLCGVIPLFVN